MVREKILLLAILSDPLFKVRKDGVQMCIP